MTFRVVNTTAMPATVTNLVASCGCTNLSDVKGKSIAPGETLVIQGVWDTEGRRGPNQTHAALGYRTDPSSRPRELLLTARATIRPVVRFAPEDGLVFDTTPSPGSALTQDVSLDSERLDSFRVVAVTPSVRWLKVEWVQPEFLRSGNQSRPARLRVTLDPLKLADDLWTPEMVHQSIRIQTNSEVSPTFTIPVHIHKTKEAGR